MSLKLEERAQKIVTHSLTDQPNIFLVGNLSQPRCVVKINELYDTQTVLQAVDLCFKSFFVLNAKYPPQCEYCFLYLQQFVYKLPRESKNFPNCVTAFHSDVLLEKQNCLSLSNTSISDD